MNLGGPGNVQLFLGNPGDYAWGREGLDAIVTQLLNQMDSTGKFEDFLFVQYIIIISMWIITSYFVKEN